MICRKANYCNTCSVPVLRCVLIIQQYMTQVICNSYTLVYLHSHWTISNYTGTVGTPVNSHILHTTQLKYTILINCTPLFTNKSSGFTIIILLQTVRYMMQKIIGSNNIQYMLWVTENNNHGENSLKFTLEKLCMARINSWLWRRIWTSGCITSSANTQQKKRIYELL